MMPYIQGDPSSVPYEYHTYSKIIESIFLENGRIGYLTIDESIAKSGKPHRGDRAKTDRAIHTEAGKLPNGIYCWGGGGSWGGKPNVTLKADVEILLANSLTDSCALWNTTHFNTSDDGDIGYAADMYPYDDAIMMQAGDVYKIGIFTPHESLPVKEDTQRQFLRIVSSGVNGNEPYFTSNPILKI